MFSPIASGRFPTRPATADGRVHPAVLEARERGVIFDIGHGMGSFAFKTARVMLDNGFMPDCISSDVHALCIDGPAFDLLTTMSKFLCIDMPLVEVIRSAHDQRGEGPAAARTLGHSSRAAWAMLRSWNCRTAGLIMSTRPANISPAGRVWPPAAL